MASEPSWVREVGLQGAAEAWAVLSGRLGEEEEEGVDHRSRGEALEAEAVLSGQEALVDLKEKEGHYILL